MTVTAYVVVADVVGSRDIANRGAFRQSLEDALAGANDRYADAIDAPFRVLKGVDELGGVLADPAPTYRLVRDLLDAVHPVTVRFAVVRGEIDVGVGGEDVTSMDGPAFHRADELLETISRQDRYLGWRGGLPAVDPLLEISANLLLFAREDWTDNQRDVVEAYGELGTQAEVADALGVSQQAVSAALGRAEWGRLEPMEATVSAAFRGYPSG